MFKVAGSIILVFMVGLNCQNSVLQLTCAQKKAFVDGHNLRRFIVAQGFLPGQPPASDMKVMIWDEELALKAALWASHGVFGHNPDRTIASKRWDLVGENVYISQYYSTEEVEVVPDIEVALDEWYSEHKNYGFEPFTLGTEKPIGHYTQMVWAGTTRVGCGIAQRKVNWTETLFVCDYGPTGNYLGQLPYATNGQRGLLRCAKDMQCGKPYGLYC